MVKAREGCYPESAGPKIFEPVHPKFGGAIIPGGRGWIPLIYEAEVNERNE
jgi:hypothetical protein